MLKNKLVLLLFLLVVKAILVSFLILFAGVGLGPDEAQYWTWSKELAWGYYSKPPGIAWQIRLGTILFGDTEFGVRFGSILLGSILPIAVFYLAKSARLSESIAFWAAVLMAFTPLGFLATFFAITDVGVVLFWTFCLIPIIDAIEREETPNYYLLGVLIAFGALFKWQIYWIWLLIAILLYFFAFLRSYHVFGGLVLSLLGLLPSFYWNMHHEWATFRHVGATFKGAEEVVRKGNFFDFLGAQAALVSPIVFLLLLFSFKAIPKAKSSLKVLGGSCLVILALHCVIALFKKMQGNWCDYAYPAGFVFLAWFCEKGMRLRILQIGIAISIVLVMIAFSFPLLHRNGLLPYKINPFRHNVGWDNLDDVLLQAGYQPETDFLFANSYQTTSILSFYNKFQNRAYFLNINGIRKNQFSFWPQMKERELHKNGFFILIENGKDSDEKLRKETTFFIDKLRPYFTEVREVGIYPLYSSGSQVTKSALLLKGYGYNGLMPSASSQY